MRRWEGMENHPSLFEREDLGPRSIFTGKHLQSVAGDGASQQAPTSSSVATGAPLAGTEAEGERAPGLTEAAPIGGALSPQPSAAPVSGADLRDEGMAKVLRVDDIWNGRAEALIRHLAQTGALFTAEDISDRLGLPEHRNAVGALLRSLAAKNLIEKTGDYVQSSRPERRCGLIAVWRGVA